MIGRLRQGFSSVKRGNYGKLQQEDVRHFQSLLKEHQVLADQDSVQPYNKCYLNKYFGQSKLVLLPETTEQVSNIMKYCTSKRLAVVPQGGNTGLVGGSVPVFDEIVLSTRRFNKIENFDTISGVLSCEAGCILEKTNDEIAKHNYEIPFDLGAKGSCMLGANASTHASGKYFIKYGPFRGNILGLEVVLADGTILDMRSRIRKDNTGIDLKQLFISSEGTLGIITKLDINCVKMDLKRQVILMKTQKFENILAAVGKAK
jgi:FAD/FMN-containing dehydrogenase